MFALPETSAVVQSKPKLLTVEDFIADYGDNSRYELIDGELTDGEPTGPHEGVAAFISRELNVEIDRREATYFIPHRCLIRGLSTVTAFRPDIIVLDKAQLIHEPLWQKEPVITLGSSVKLVVEVVSTNWQNDYARKQEDYALLGIPEYWIVDYLGLGGRDYIGNPKQPTVSLCYLSGDEYERRQFQNDETLQSRLFPELSLTAEQIFNAAV